MTNILGIKLTHDAAVAGISDGKLIFCVEMEKIKNQPRYTKMLSDEDIDMVLDHFNFKPDVIVFDGWKHKTAPSPAITLEVGSYHEFDGDHLHLLDGIQFPNPDDPTESVGSYHSFPHIASHVIGAYVTSPFAKNRECAYIITWDGGQNPRVHYLDPGIGIPEFRCSLFEMYSIIYGIMGYYYGPYKQPEIASVPLEEIKDRSLFGTYEWPGKLMSYIALGEPHQDLVSNMMGIYYRLTEPRCGWDPLGYNQDGILEHSFMREVVDLVNDRFPFLSDADVLHTIHLWLQTMLVDNAVAKIPKGANLCFTGGSALNIKWNSALRNTNHFTKVYVPPFPNDSGSALGTAACAMVTMDKIWDLDWSVYAGMPIIEDGVIDNWSGVFCSIDQLADFFAKNPSTPVVVLNGRAEIGPRALGNRSIMCAAIEPSTKALLNQIKRRESFRPVAPICMEEYAPHFFSPGTPDPYMLFDHHVRKEMLHRIPAIVHIDETARLQTINREQNELIYQLLSGYYERTGIPLLCNTSANLNGSGFFPDVTSAMRWGGCDYIWCNNTLYFRSGSDVR